MKLNSLILLLSSTFWKSLEKALAPWIKINDERRLPWGGEFTRLIHPSELNLIIYIFILRVIKSCIFFHYPHCLGYLICYLHLYSYESYKILLSFHFPHCSSYLMCYYGVVLILYLVQRPLIIGTLLLLLFFILLSLFAMIFDVGEMLLQNVIARFAMVRVMITSFYNCW